MDMAIELSVVIPAKNEVNRLPATLEKVLRYLAGLEIEWEVIVVDNGSQDGTDRLVEEVASREPRVKLVKEARPGKGAALRTGMLQAEGEIVLFSDADLSCPIEEEKRLREALQKGYDVAIASRRLPESQVEKTLGRRLASALFNGAVQLLALPGIKDSQCGFKAFRREAARRLFGAGRIDGWAFDVEILFLARRLGLRIVEAPVRWEQAEGSRVRAFRDGASMLLDVLRMRWHWACGEYEVEGKK